MLLAYRWESRLVVPQMTRERNLKIPLASPSRRSLAIAFQGGCCTKPARKSSSALAEVHARAAVRDDVGTDRPLATNGMGVFGAHP